jgi:hypothetical protein
MPFVTRSPWRIDFRRNGPARIDLNLAGLRSAEVGRADEKRRYVKHAGRRGMGHGSAGLARIGATFIVSALTCTQAWCQKPAPPGHRAFAQDVLPQAAKPAAKRVFMARQSALCLSATADAEQRYHLPHGLLAAISRVETGRPMPVTGDRQPWPWSVNADGETLFFDTRAEAVAETSARLDAARQGHGPHYVDIGCMQVDITIHRRAFATLADAFNPAVNADYAARLMVSLHGRGASWQAASQNYHSATPALGVPYGSDVARFRKTQTDTLSSAIARE